MYQQIILKIAVWKPSIVLLVKYYKYNFTLLIILRDQTDTNPSATPADARWLLSWNTTAETLLVGS